MSKLYKKSLLEKAKSILDISQENISFVLQTQYAPESPRIMPFYEGIYTIKNIGMDIDTGFKLAEANMVKGFFEANGQTQVNFISNRRKLFKSFTASFYHIFLDDFSQIILAMELYPDAELIFDISAIKPSLNEQSWDFFKTFLTILRENNKKFTLIELSNYEIVYINNFSLIKFPYQSGLKADIVYDFFKQHVKDKKIKPHKKVFVSRTKVASKMPKQPFGKLNFLTDERIDDHVMIENFFKDRGFEIIYPEDFDNFEDQLNFFYSVKTIASLTSSGLANSCFMQPGGEVIELMSPMLVNHPILRHEETVVSDSVVVEIHSFYQHLCFLKNHLYIGIPNYSRSAQDVISYCNSNATIKEILDN